MNGGTWEGNVGSNGAQNRSLTLKNVDQILPVVYLNNLAEITTVFPLTFELNLATQIAQGAFDPASGTVSVAGDAINSWTTSVSPLTRSATETNVWQGTFEITNSVGGVVVYKFVLNDSTWESIDNRSYSILSTNAQSVPRVWFNNVNHLGSIVVGPITGGQATLTWSAGPLVRLQTSTNLDGSVWQEVPNTLGQGSATVSMGTGRSFYRLIGP
jgi:hypothetical protein